MKNSAAVQAGELAFTRSTLYPAPFAARVAGRTKRKLGTHFGLATFGVNHRLAQAAVNPNREGPSHQDNDGKQD